MNDRDDFLPEVRNAAWWSGDSRMAANGRAVEAILIKQGKHEREDISDLEPVKMGHIMQPLIGRLAQDRLGIELKDADYALTHSKESWLKSHFDFISTDGTTLVEAKNYNAAYRNKFDPEENRIPAADYIQLLHEATVHNVSKVVLAVLFGGQEFQTFDFQFGDDEKQALYSPKLSCGLMWSAETRPHPKPLSKPSLCTPSQHRTRLLQLLKQLSKPLSICDRLRVKLRHLSKKRKLWNYRYAT